MQRMVLGGTGLEAYRLGFGGIPIQRVSEAAAVATVRYALEQGLDFIDTSRAYTTSERRIGKALKEFQKASGNDAHRVIVASKSYETTASAVRADLETSLQELDLDHIHLYQCHFVRDDEEYETVTSPGGALEGLRDAKDEGLIGHIGITSHSQDVLEQAVDDGLFDTIMVCFSFLEPQAKEGLIPKALAQDVGVLAMKPFSGGVIEDAELGLRFALSEPGVLVLAGVESQGLFDENWGTFRAGVPLSETDRARIAEIQRVHDKVFCRRCDYCQPCSEGIPIQLVLGTRSLVKRLGLKALMDGPFGEGIEKGRNCTECGDCMTRCPYDLPIPDLIRENLRWLDEQTG
jgi:predicted aldo/keto reductase-like oxidoreductase